MDYLNVVVYGGSNSFMAAGYTRSMKSRLEFLLNKEVVIHNDSMGNTFSSFALFQCDKNKKHINADVIIIEYAINDHELFNLKCGFYWQKSYEGLLRRVRLENPNALVCSVILSPRNRLRRGINPVSMRVDYLSRYYGALVVDIETEFERAGITDLPSKIYRDNAHYSAAYQSWIGAVVARRIVDALLEGEYDPIPSPKADSYSDCRVAYAKDLAASGEYQEVKLENSRVSYDALKLKCDNGIKFDLDGELVAIIYGATKRDGIIKISNNGSSRRISTYRSGFVDFNGDSFTFLVSIIAPCLATASPVVNKSLGPVEISLAPPDPSEKNDVFMRGSVAWPPEHTIDPEFNLIGVVYTGEMNPSLDIQN